MNCFVILSWSEEQFHKIMYILHENAEIILLQRNIRTIKKLTLILEHCFFLIFY